MPNPNLRLWWSLKRLSRSNPSKQRRNPSQGSLRRNATRVSRLHARRLTLFTYVYTHISNLAPRDELAFSTFRVFVCVAITTNSSFSLFWLPFRKFGLHYETILPWVTSLRPIRDSNTLISFSQTQSSVDFRFHHVVPHLLIWNSILRYMKILLLGTLDVFANLISIGKYSSPASNYWNLWFPAV